MTTTAKPENELLERIDTEFNSDFCIINDMGRNHADQADCYMSIMGELVDLRNDIARLPDGEVKDDLAATEEALTLIAEDFAKTLENQTDDLNRFDNLAHEHIAHVSEEEVSDAISDAIWDTRQAIRNEAERCFKPDLEEALSKVVRLAIDAAVPNMDVEDPIRYRQLIDEVAAAVDRDLVDADELLLNLYIVIGETEVY